MKRNTRVLLYCVFIECDGEKGNFCYLIKYKLEMQELTVALRDQTRGGVGMGTGD